VHGVDAKGAAVVARSVRRGGLLKFFASLPRRPVGMEACGSAHHWDYGDTLPDLDCRWRPLRFEAAAGGGAKGRKDPTAVMAGLVPRLSGSCRAPA